MTPPRWLDEHGRERRTRPRHRCHRPTPVAYSYRVDHLRMIGWQLFSEAQIVQVRRPHQFLVVPHADGEWAVLVPILGEAA